jgi:anti-sigma B factor antagonist
MMAEFRASSTWNAGPDPGAVVTVEGEIDIATAGKLDEALADAAERGGRITVDLSRVRFMDSAGVKVLFKRAEQVRLDLLVPPRGIVAPVVAITGLDSVVTVRTAPA